MLETLANKGNGNYGYIDSIKEGEKILVEDFYGTMYTVARDVKAKVTFNPDKVSQYRLLGYENKMLTSEEYDDTTTDGGEIGSGFAVTALYEVILNAKGAELTDKFLTVSVRYKNPGISDPTDYEISKDLYDIISFNEDLSFISAVCEFALILRNSNYKAQADLNNVILRLEQLDCTQSDNYKNEFINLCKLYKTNY